jgi:hypothetical protein
MEKKRKAGARHSQQATVHPETQPQGGGLADESSSKRRANGGQQDARTGHDKDGNEQQVRTNKGSR